MAATSCHRQGSTSDTAVKASLKTPKCKADVCSQCPTKMASCPFNVSGDLVIKCIETHSQDGVSSGHSERPLNAQEIEMLACLPVTVAAPSCRVTLAVGRLSITSSDNPSGIDGPATADTHLATADTRLATRPSQPSSPPYTQPAQSNNLHQTKTTTLQVYLLIQVISNCSKRNTWLKIVLVTMSPKAPKLADGSRISGQSSQD